MTWPRNIEQWRKFAIWESRDIPPDLMLAIIATESGGIAGRLSHATTKSADVPKADGSTVTFNHAMGLTQCIPSIVSGYNKNFPEPAYFEDMTGQDERATRLQIRMGAWVFANMVNTLHRFDPSAFPGVSPGNATPDQLKLALVAYAIGPGKEGGKRGLIPRLEKLREQGLSFTLDNLQRAFPKWGYSEEKGAWINRPVFSALKKWRLYEKNAQPGKPGLTKPSNPLSLPDFPTLETAAKKIKANWLWLAIAGALWLVWGNKHKGGGEVIQAGAAKIIGRK